MAKDNQAHIAAMKFGLGAIMLASLSKISRTDIADVLDDLHGDILTGRLSADMVFEKDDKEGE